MLHLLEVQVLIWKVLVLHQGMDIHFSVKRGLVIITWRPYFGSKRQEVTGVWRILHSDKLHGIYSHQVLFRWTNPGEWDGWVMWHMRKKTNADRVLVGKPKGKRQLEDLGIDTILLNLILKKYKRKAWTESIWLRSGTSDRLLWKGLCKMWGISWLAVELLPYQVDFIPWSHLVHLLSYIKESCHRWSKFH